MSTVTNVLDWLEATAERVPDKVAVEGVDTRLTFAELLELARRAGSWLLTESGADPQRGTAQLDLAVRSDGAIRPDASAPCGTVAFYLEKSPHALAAMLGAVCAGCFYSVLDVRQPQIRLEAICAALQPRVIVSDDLNIGAAREVFCDTPWRVVSLNDLLASDVDDGALAAARAQAVDVDPLYVNFTSGSTGTPKGVVVSHRSVIDFIPQLDALFGIGEQDVLGNQAPFDFDVSVKDIYSCLYTGATLVLIPRDYFSIPAMLMDYLADREVTVLIWAVSALCFVSIMGGFDYRVPSRVRLVMFSGEVMPPKQLRVWRESLPDARYVNLYGPTEITCNCTYHEVTPEEIESGIIPMGRPFANERVFLLDGEDREVVEPGVEGEICVSGTCLALGYLGEPERTRAAFVQNPLNSRWLETVYRTGDLATYDEAGDLVYATRKDNQIKHMGQRIELGDIEAAAQRVEGVDQAVCLYDHRRHRIHLCYVGAVETSDVAARLRELLPQYMVPGRTHRLDDMPLTKNGKADRKAIAADLKI